MSTKARPKGNQARAHRPLTSRFVVAGWALAAMLSALALVPLRGQEDNRTVFPVQMTGSVGGTNYYLNVPGVGVVQDAGSSTQAVNTTLTFSPGQIYTITATAENPPNPGDPSGWATLGLTFTPPPGYTMFIQTIDTTGPLVQTQALSDSAQLGSNTATWQVEMRDDRWNAPVTAGRIARLGVGDFILELGMGVLANGKSAGRLVLRDSGALSGGSYHLSACYSPSSVSYTPPDATASYGPVGSEWQASTPSVLVRIVSVSQSPPQYTISFYAKDSSGNVAGTPYAVYTLGQPASLGGNEPSASQADGLRIVETQGSVSVTHDVFRWHATDQWTLVEGDRRVDRTNAPSSLVDGEGDTLTTSVQTVTTTNGSGQVAAQNRYTYYPSSTGANLLLQQDIGYSLAGFTALTTSYDYYLRTTDGAGHLNQVRQVTAPNGAVTSYDYYDDALDQGNLKSVTSQWYAGSGSSQTQTTTYTYTGPSGAILNQYPATSVVTIGGTTVAQTAYSYDFTTSSPEGKPLVRQTAKASANGSTWLQTLSVSYAPDTDYVYSERPYATSLPTGAQQSFRYEEGSWNSGVFTPGSGNAWLTTVVSGSSTGGGTQVNSVPDPATGGSLAIEPIYLVPGKSTLTQIVRDAQENVLSQTTYAYASTGFDTAHPIAQTANTYLDSIRQSQASALNGATSTWAWNGAYLQSQTDPTGIATSYTYDGTGRIATKTRAGASSTAGLPAQADLTTTYAYDAANRIISATESSGALSRATAYGYDPAGRSTSVVLPDGRQSSTAYAILSGGDTQVTQTLPCGGTIVTTTLPDGKTLSTTGDVPAATYNSYSVAPDGTLVTQTNYGSASSVRYLRQTTDWLGRVIQTVQPGPPGFGTVTQSNSFDGATGLLAETTRTGWANTYYLYNSLGQLTRSGADLDNSGALETTSASDRITDTDTSFSWDGSAWWALTTTSAYPSATAVVMGVQGQRLTGFASGLFAESYTADRNGNKVTTQTFADPANKLVTTKVYAPGVGSPQQTLVLNGLTEETVSPDGRSLVSTYDGLGRLTSAADSRTGTTSYAYLTNGSNATDQVGSVTNPAGGVTSYGYDAGGRVNFIQNPAGHDTRCQYDCHGRLVRQWGDGAMPVEYVYDSYSQRTEIHTFRGGQPSDWNTAAWPASQTADVTTFTYDEPTGLLTEKRDASSQPVDYTYNSQGLPATRQWARQVSSGGRLQTSYTYLTGTADLTGVAYNDNGATPAVGYTYNRLGEPVTVTDATGTRTFGYDSANPERLLTEQLDSSFYSGRLLTQTYESGASGTINGRFQGYALGVSGTPARDLQAVYTYDGTGRINQLTATDGTARVFTYGYATGTSLVSQLSTALDGTAGNFTVTRSYDAHWDLPQTIQTQAGAASPPAVAQYDYAYDALGRRQSAKQSGTAFADLGSPSYYRYTYDAQGRLSQAYGYLGTDPTQTAASEQMSGRLHDYGYDPAGNRVSANHTGNAGVAEVATTSVLNQLTSKENHTVAVQGTANASANVLVAGVSAGGPLNSPAGRTGAYWGGEAMLNNSSGPAYTSVNIVAALVGSNVMTSQSKSMFLPQNPQSLSYDADGNLISDGVWDYTYDAENRLTQMTPATAVMNLTGYGAKQLKFTYDYLGRRVDKQVYIYNGGWMLSAETKFVYAGWNLIAETDASGNLQRTYAWGLDLAGSLGATGGIGALAEITDHANGSAYFPAYDGGGNVAALVKAADGSVAAAYEYDPYGQLLRKEGGYAASNPWRFSTHYWDEESGLVYYGYRFYSPALGRFVNRDPSGEQGGINLYAFAGNDPANEGDVLGLFGVPSGQVDKNGWPIYIDGDDIGQILNAQMIDQANGLAALYGVPPQYKDFADEMDHFHQQYLYNQYLKTLNDPLAKSLPNPDDLKKAFGSTTLNLPTGIGDLRTGFSGGGVPDWQSLTPSQWVEQINLQIWGPPAAAIAQNYMQLGAKNNPSHWQRAKEVIGGGITVVLSIPTMLVGAATSESGFGIPVAIGGAVAFGLGATSVAHGLSGEGPVTTPTGAIPMGPIELIGAMTGNANLQIFGGMLDSVLPLPKPEWPTVGTATGILLNGSPDLDPNAWPFGSKTIPSLVPSQNIPAG